MSTSFVIQMSHHIRHKNAETLSVWLFIAAVIHAILLIGVSFISPNAEKVGEAIEVTIVNSATKRAPDNAKYFAQNNQIAAGTANQKPMPMESKKPSIGEDSHKQRATQARDKKVRIQHRLITRKSAPKRLESAEKQERSEETGEETEEQPELSMEELDRQIAQLGAKIASLKESSEKTTIKSINAISAHKFDAALYVKEWERKVERIGNLNIPEINGTQNYSGILSMDVGINADGSIYDVKIVESSGTPELDRAAENIVRMSAPFAPLPEEIYQQLDVLRIRRIWNFSDEGDITTSTELVN
jgi:periplasmic protein TonB